MDVKNELRMARLAQSQLSSWAGRGGRKMHKHKFKIIKEASKEADMVFYCLGCYMTAKIPKGMVRSIVRGDNWMRSPYARRLIASIHGN